MPDAPLLRLSTQVFNRFQGRWLAGDKRGGPLRLDLRPPKMRPVLLVAIATIAIMASLTGCAQHMIGSSDLKAEEQRVLATEDEYVAAEVSRDEATLRRLIDDRFVFNSSQGTTSGKEELIQSVLKMNMVGQSVRERSVLIDGDVAFVFGTADLRFARPGSAESASALRYTATYVKRQGQWGMLVLQMQQREHRP